MDFVDYDVEAAVAVNQFDDGHGSDEEHDNLAGISQGYHKVVGEFGILATHGIDGPQDTAHQQGECGFVDVCDMFKRYHQISDDKHYKHHCNHLAGYVLGGIK